jgi:hypothetical protein
MQDLPQSYKSSKKNCITVLSYNVNCKRKIWNEGVEIVKVWDPAVASLPRLRPVTAQNSCYVFWQTLNKCNIAFHKCKSTFFPFLLTKFSYNWLLQKCKHGKRYGGHLVNSIIPINCDGWLALCSWDLHLVRPESLMFFWFEITNLSFKGKWVWSGIQDLKFVGYILMI